MEGGDTVDLLNRLMRTEKPWQGLLLHVPDYSKSLYLSFAIYLLNIRCCIANHDLPMLLLFVIIVESGSGYLPMSHYNQHFKASNPTYPLTYDYHYEHPDITEPDDRISKAFPGFVTMDAPVCPAVGPTECSNGKGGTYDVEACKGVGPEIWDLACVTEVYGTKYAANSGLPDYIESKAKGKVCYPTDANAVDKRDPSGNGACHTMNGNYQDYVCNDNDSICLSKSNNDCKCEYGDIPNEGEGVGQWIVDYGTGSCGKIR